VGGRKEREREKKRKNQSCIAIFIITIHPPPLTIFFITIKYTTIKPLTKNSKNKREVDRKKKKNQNLHSPL
jgi:hypothetical protein